MACYPLYDCGELLRQNPLVVLADGLVERCQLLVCSSILIMHEVFGDNQSALLYIHLCAVGCCCRRWAKLRLPWWWWAYRERGCDLVDTDWTRTSEAA